MTPKRIPELTQAVLQYFFYFNRIVGVFVSWVLRLLLWKSNNAYFEIGGISLSLLGGEIIFNDVRYISRNQSLRIVRGECSASVLTSDASADVKSHRSRHVEVLALARPLRGRQGIR